MPEALLDTDGFVMFKCKDVFYRVDKKTAEIYILAEMEGENIATQEKGKKLFIKEASYKYGWKLITGERIERRGKADDKMSQAEYDGIVAEAQAEVRAFLFALEADDEACASTE